MKRAHDAAGKDAGKVLDRRTLYRLPWSKVDTAGGWVEVTDACDFRCPGCYRHRLEGHRSLAEVQDEVREVARLTNCDRIAIAGGEPLLWPHTVELVRFIARLRLKPVLLTHGEHLTRDLARELAAAGLAKYHFHVDSGMQRPGWEDCTETEMNELRQRFADLVFEVGGVQCGFNITIFRRTLPELPSIVDWCRANLDRVQHVSLIAFRSIPVGPPWQYRCGDRWIDASRFQHSTQAIDELSVTTDEMHAVLRNHEPDYRTCAYLSGTAAPETSKFLIAVRVGSARELYGYLGPRTLELLQTTHHVVKGRYPAFLRNPRVGKKVFLMSSVDRSVRTAAARYVAACARNPARLGEAIFTQSISLQQPNEVLNGEVNLCDGCLNQMLWNGRLIPSCRLDEYRMFGDEVVPMMAKATGP